MLCGMLLLVWALCTTGALGFQAGKSKPSTTTTTFYTLEIPSKHVGSSRPACVRMHSGSNRWALCKKRSKVGCR